MREDDFLCGHDDRNYTETEEKKMQAYELEVTIVALENALKHARAAKVDGETINALVNALGEVVRMRDQIEKEIQNEAN